MDIEIDKKRHFIKNGGPVPGSTLSLTYWDGDSDSARGVLTPWKPGVTASVTVGTGKLEGIFSGNSGMIPNLCCPSLNFTKSMTIIGHFWSKKGTFVIH